MGRLVRVFKVELMVLLGLMVITMALLGDKQEQTNDYTGGFVEVPENIGVWVKSSGLKYIKIPNIGELEELKDSNLKEVFIFRENMN